MSIPNKVVQTHTHTHTYKTPHHKQQKTQKTNPQQNTF